MRSFGCVLATVLCAIQLTVALPRPDFGIGIDVYSAGKTGSIALDVNAGLADLWNDDPISLTSGYTTLSNLLTEMNAIGNSFHDNIETLFTAINTLATADSDVTGSFQGVTAAIDALTTSISYTANYATIDTALPDNYIVDMLTDAFDEVDFSLSALGSVKDTLKSQIDSAVAHAGGEASVTKAILRYELNTETSSGFTAAVDFVRAQLPLAFFILMKTKSLLKTADDYILEATDAATAAVDYIDEGLQALADEISSYGVATSELRDILDPVTTANTDFSALDLTLVPDIATELDHITGVYTEDLTYTITDMIASYQDHIPDVQALSTDMLTFYTEKACDQIYAVVEVLINHGPYAEYCYHKFGPEALIVYEQHARTVHECIDREITRLMILHELLLATADQMVFSMEDLLATATACVANSDEANASSIDYYIQHLHYAVEDLETFLEDVVYYETQAQLARLKACIATNNYYLLLQIIELNDALDVCQTQGPNDA